MFERNLSRTYLAFVEITVLNRTIKSQSRDRMENLAHKTRP